MFEVLTRQIASALGKKYGSKTQRSFLAQCQSEWENGHRIVNANTPENAKQHWLAHQTELQEAIARGDLDKIDAYGRQEFEAECAEIMEAGRAARRSATMKAAPVIQELASEFALDAERFAGEQAKLEADAYEKFGIAYPGPSVLVQHLRKAADFARARVPRSQFADAQPKDCVPYVNL